MSFTVYAVSSAALYFIIWTLSSPVLTIQQGWLLGWWAQFDVFGPLVDPYVALYSHAQRYRLTKRIACKGRNTKKKGKGEQPGFHFSTLGRAQNKLDLCQPVWFESTDSTCSMRYFVVLAYLYSALMRFHYCAQHSSKQNLTELNLITATTDWNTVEKQRAI